MTTHGCVREAETAGRVPLVPNVGVVRGELPDHGRRVLARRLGEIRLERIVEGHAPGRQQLTAEYATDNTAAAASAGGTDRRVQQVDDRYPNSTEQHAVRTQYGAAQRHEGEREQDAMRTQHEREGRIRRRGGATVKPGVQEQGLRHEQDEREQRP